MSRAPRPATTKAAFEEHARSLLGRRILHVTYDEIAILFGEDDLRRFQLGPFAPRTH